MKSNTIIACALLAAVLAVGCIESTTSQQPTASPTIEDDNELPPLPPDDAGENNGVPELPEDNGEEDFPQLPE